MIYVCSECKYKDKIKDAKCSKGGCRVQWGFDQRLYTLDPCQEYERIVRPMQDLELERW